MQWHQTVQNMYGVSESALDEMVAGYNSIFSVFFGAFAGAAITLWVLFTTAVEPKKRYCCDLAFLCSGLALICLVAFVSSFARAYRRKKKLYKEAVPIKWPQ